MRSTLDDMYVKMLAVIETRSTCRRRSTASIITDVEGRVLSLGYNGVPKGVVHCIDQPCHGVSDPSGIPDRCLAVHAEQNSLLQCVYLQTRAHTIYTSATPCFSCAKLILNTPIRRVVARDLYPDVAGFDLLREHGVEIVILGERK